MAYTVTEGNYRKFGVQKEKDGVIFTFSGEKEDNCAIVFYQESMEIETKIEAPAKFRRGAVRSVFVHGVKPEKLRYNYEINGKILTDVYATKIVGRERWRDESRRERDYAVCGGAVWDKFEWKCSAQPEVKRGEMVLYKLHVRGFSMDAGFRGRERGTFEALEKKIPYLKKLGVTTIELMPVYEFEELLFPVGQKLPEYINWKGKSEREEVKTEEKPSRVNYWGYTKGNYFAVKASYSRSRNAAREFKHLIDTLHENDMECVMEMYFERMENQNLILDAIRYWTLEFRVDGFHLIGQDVPIVAVAQDFFLKRTKIFCEQIPQELWQQKENYPHLYLYNEEYLYTARKLLNHQGGTLQEFCNQQKKQRENIGFVNFLAGNNGFTLLDTFSYCEKHNEANGEENADGLNFNFSINCGTEGKTSRKYVNEQRRKHLYMAFCMLFFAQAVPLILAGDEFLNSQQGNNNAYCQDNKTGWLNWRETAEKKRLTDFVAKLAAFRRAHPVLRREEPMRLNDYLHLGCPDLSYHSDNAWALALPEEKGAFGMMYNGSYARDDYVYTGYNFHTGVNELALPKLPEKKNWYLVMDTGEVQAAFLEKEKKVENQQKITLRPQSVVLLVGK